MRNYFTYILASQRNGTLYVGVTNNLLKRVEEHRNKKASVFTRKYKVNKLVYYEECGDINAAIQREKQLKNWKRSWKLELIEDFNPEWEDLYFKLMGLDPGSSPG
jgi:putative endonuclease